MTRYEYDEEASELHHMDVVYAVDDTPAPVVRWVDAMRRDWGCEMTALIADHFGVK